jgi:P-type conjugative transfer ATPase TrbB
VSETRIGEQLNLHPDIIKSFRDRVSVLPGPPPPRRPKEALDERPPHSASGRSEAYRRLLQKIRAELGPTLLALIESDNAVCEIDRNPDGRIFVTDLERGKYEIDEIHRLSDLAATNLIRSVASCSDLEVSHAHPIIEGTLPIRASRFLGILPPIVGGGPMFCIRKRSLLSRTFDDYVADRTLTPAQAAFIRTRIAQHDNILIVGPTGSGKTTFANAVLREICEMAQGTPRLVVLEDNAELQPAHADNVCLLTSETAGVDMDKLVKTTLRSKPDLICVGELRDHAAQALLEAWNTGHSGGLTTIHSDSAKRALSRLEDLVRKANVPVERSKIAAAINLIVVLTKDPQRGRVCSEIARVLDATQTDYKLEAGP